MEVQLSVKDQLFNVLDRILALKTKAILSNLSDSEELELRNLEVKKMQLWSEWKD